MESDEKKYDLAAVVIALVLVTFCLWNYHIGDLFYYFHMNPAYYKKVVSAIVIHCAFGIVLVRIVYLFMKVSVLKIVQNGLAACERIEVRSICGCVLWHIRTIHSLQHLPSVSV